MNNQADGYSIGMVAYRRLSAERCEMKRLYVRPEFRGAHVGGLLVDTIIDRDRKAGYGEMVLDTIVPLKSAIRLHESRGFTPRDAYYANPILRPEGHFREQCATCGSRLTCNGCSECGACENKEKRQ